MSNNFHTDFIDNSKDSNDYRKKMKFFAQKSSSEEFKNMVSDHRVAIALDKLDLFINKFLFSSVCAATTHSIEIIYTIAIKPLIPTPKQIPLDALKIFGSIPLLLFTWEGYKFLYYSLFELPDYKDKFIDDLTKYRCCYEENQAKTECIGNVPDAETCENYL